MPSDYIEQVGSQAEAAEVRRGRRLAIGRGCQAG